MIHRASRKAQTAQRAESATLSVPHVREAQRLVQGRKGARQGKPVFARYLD